MAALLPSKADFDAHLARAWEHRRNHNIEASLIEFLSLKGRIHLPVGRWDSNNSGFTRLIPEYGSPSAESLASLAAAMERAQGSVKESNRIIAETQTVLARLGSPGSFLPFERGLNAFIEGDYTSALEDFIRVRFSRDPSLTALRQSGLLNAILCLENLGLPYGGLLKELCSEPDLSAGIASQLQALELRCDFREGRLHFVELSGLQGQTLYFSAWVSQLPYLLPKASRSERKAEFMATQSGVFHRTFRSRTLQGVLAPEDLRSSKPSELVDRFYLWVWQWLENSNDSLLKKCLTLLSEGLLLERLDTFTREDSALLENALLWLALFDVECAKRLSEISRRIPRTQSGAFPILELERLTLDYLLARKTGQTHLLADFKNRLESHVLWQQPQILFRSWIESLDKYKNKTQKPVTPLEKRLCLLFDLGRPEKSSSLQVDLAKGLITDLKGVQTISHAMSQVLWTIRNEQAPSLERMAEACFGIRRFDPTIHASKISNLLSRTRKLLPPDALIQTQEGRVVAAGDWSGIQFAGADSQEIRLSQLTAWGDVFQRTPESAKGRVLAQAQPSFSNEGSTIGIPEEMNREELERLMNRPRSTTNRLIASWIQRGYLVREGLSRATRYRLSPEFRRLIVTKGVPK